MEVIDHVALSYIQRFKS